MRLSRKRAGRDIHNAKEYSLVKEELPDDPGYSPYIEHSSSDPFSLRIRGFDTREDAFSSYWYRITFTPREMKGLLSRYIRMEKIPDVEKKLWEVLLILWERRLKRLDRKQANKTLN